MSPKKVLMVSAYTERARWRRKMDLLWKEKEKEEKGGMANE